MYFLQSTVTLASFFCPTAFPATYSFAFMFAEVHLLDELLLLMQYFKVICVSSSKRPAIVGHPSALHRNSPWHRAFYSFLQCYKLQWLSIPSLPFSFLLPLPFLSPPCLAVPFLTSLCPVVATFLPSTAAFSPSLEAMSMSGTGQLGLDVLAP